MIATSFYVVMPLKFKKKTKVLNLRITLWFILGLLDVLEVSC